MKLWMQDDDIEILIFDQNIQHIIKENLLLLKYLLES